MEYFLIDSLIKKSQQIIADKEELFLEKISFDDEELQGLWYKMLKGSKFYDFEKKVGYPSIFEFISYYESKKETICMQKVSYQMLVCLFNEKIASDIKENQKIKSKKAKRKVTYLARKDLDDILSNNKFEQKNFNMLEHLTFSTHKNHKNTSSLIICKDLKTKISIKKKN